MLSTTTRDTLLLRLSQSCARRAVSLADQAQGERRLERQATMAKAEALAIAAQCYAAALAVYDEGVKRELERHADALTDSTLS